MMEEEDNKQDVPGVNPVTDELGNPDPEKVDPAQVQQVEPVQEEVLQEQPEQEAPQAEVQQPTSIINEEYSNTLMQAGFTPEQIGRLGQNPDPQSFLNGLATQTYKQTVQEPEPIDEKKMERHRKFAAIGDVLSLFSQAAGAAQGAHLRERKFEEGAMARLSENQRKLYDRYLQEADRYSKGLVNAQMQDYLQGHKNWKETENDMRKTLAAYRKEKIDAAKQAQKDAIEREKLDNQTRRLDAFIKDSDRRLRVAEQNARTAAIRAATYDKRADAWIDKTQLDMENRNSRGKTYDYEVMIPAHPNDPNAFTNDNGDLVTIIGVSKAEKEYIAKQALKDEEFIRSLEQEDRALALAVTTGSLTATQRSAITDLYLQQRYNNDYGIKPGGIVVSNASSPKYSGGRPLGGEEHGRLAPPMQTGDGSSVEEVTQPIGQTEIQRQIKQVQSDKEFLEAVKRVNPQLHDDIVNDQILWDNDWAEIIQAREEWIDEKTQVETTIQQVQESEDEMNPDDEFKIVGTI